MAKDDAEATAQLRKDWHSCPVDEVWNALKVTVKGLTDEEVQDRLSRYGRNELTPPKKISFAMRLFLQIHNVLIYILLAAAIVSGALREWPEVGLILGVIVINVAIGLIQEGKAEKATEAIKNMLSPKATVIRNGQQQEINGGDLVPGDVVFIKGGDSVPADLRVFECSNLKILEAMLTGESNPVGKFANEILGGQNIALGDRKNMAFSATMVQSGQGKGVVVCTGDATEIGKIGAMVSQQESVKTNLIVQLEIFGRYISALVLVIAGITFALAFAKANEPIGTAFNSAISIAVAIIPEGLPAVVTISLALAMQLLAGQNAIVKQLPAIETLGSITVICSDKTGTLTKNEMTVQKVQTSSCQYQIQGVGYAPFGTIMDEAGTQVSEDLRSRLCAMLEGAVLCNDASLQVSKSSTGAELYNAVGYPTEASLITLGLKLGVKDVAMLKSAKPRRAAVPFASEHKFMCCLHSEGPTADAPMHLHVKGASDRVLAMCKDQICGDNLVTREPINHEFWDRSVHAMSAQGLRCLAVAVAEWTDAVPDEMSADILLKAPSPFLTLVGMVAILDPPRPDAIAACGVAKTAGIIVKMITGDHPSTAKAIAAQLGIVSAIEEHHVQSFTGPELDRMSDEELDAVVMGCNVFARASPENKIKIVKSLQRVGQTCSMTGDGVNDAPALKAANIGVAMGITGTDVSKEAAKMILVDDNFATIVLAVREGRRVWDNLVKILLYNMPVNFAQGFSVFMAYVINLETVPLTAIQVLYVNMITSVTMGLMLAMEPAEASVMTRPPRRHGKRLFGRMVMWHCLFVASIIVTSVLINFHWELARHPHDDELAHQVPHERGGRRSEPSEVSTRILKGRACAFNMLVFGEIAYAINCRYIKETSVSMKMLTDNIWCWISICLTAILQVFLTYTPHINKFFSNEGIDGEAWGRILAFSVAIFIVVEIEKLLGPKYVMPHLRKLGLCGVTPTSSQCIMRMEAIVVTGDGH